MLVRRRAVARAVRRWAGQMPVPPFDELAEKRRWRTVLPLLTAGALYLVGLLALVVLVWRLLESGG